MKKFLVVILLMVLFNMTPAEASCMIDNGNINPPDSALTIGQVDDFLKNSTGRVRLLFKVDDSIIKYYDFGEINDAKERNDLSFGRDRYCKIDFEMLGNIIRKYPNLRIDLEIVDIEGYFVSVLGFSNCDALVSVTIPKSVEHISDNAFRNCRNLESVVIKNKSLTFNIDGHNVMLIKIGDYYAFSLLEFQYGIDCSAFWGCVHFQSKENENIGVLNGMDFFYVDDNMTYIEIPGHWAYYLSIRNYLRDFDNVRSIKVTSGVETMGIKYRDDDLDWKHPIAINLFVNCPNLVSIEFEDGIRMIGSINGLPNLETIVFPKSLEYIGDLVYNPKLKNVNIPANFSDFSDEYHCITGLTGNESLESIVVPEGVERISSNAFANCKSLKTIKFPSSLKVIETSDGGCGENGGYFCSPFFKCESLDNVVLPDWMEEIPPYLFWGCSSLKNVVIPPSVKKISHHAFANCKSLETIVLPQDLQEIGDFAFEGCKKLRKINIPESVLSIGKGAFWACEALKKGKTPNTVSIKGRLFDYFPDTLYLDYPNGEVPENAFNGFTSLKKVVLSENIKKINSEAFFNCFSLRSVKALGDLEVEYNDNGILGECNELVLADFNGINLQDSHHQFKNLDTLVLRSDKYWGDSDFFFGKEESFGVVGLDGDYQEYIIFSVPDLNPNAKIFVQDSLVERYVQKMKSSGYVFTYEFLPLSEYRD